MQPLIFANCEVFERGQAAKLPLAVQIAAFETLGQTFCKFAKGSTPLDFVNRTGKRSVASVLRATLVKNGETQKTLGFFGDNQQHEFLAVLPSIYLILLAIPAGFEPATLRVEI